MERGRFVVWLAGCATAWVLLTVPAAIAAFYAGRIFDGGPATVAQWVTVCLWVAFPGVLVGSVAAMWLLRRTHPVAAVVVSIAPIVVLGAVAALVVVVR